MHMMAWSLTTEERAEVRGAFLEMDISRTGAIHIHEFQQVLKQRFHLDAEYAEQVFMALDANHDDEIHYSEFLAAMMATRLKFHDELLKATFRRFDRNSNGFITLENLREVLGPSVEESGLAEVLKNLDSNKDGHIDYEEFIGYLRLSSDADTLLNEAAHAAIDRELAITGREGTATPARMRRRTKVKNTGKHVGKQVFACVGFGDMGSTVVSPRGA